MLNPPTGQPVEDVDGEPFVYPADERPAQIDQTVQLPLLVTPLVECGQGLVVIGAEVEEQLGRFLAGRVELRAHLRRIVLNVAAALSLHLGTQFGLFQSRHLPRNTEEKNWFLKAIQSRRSGTSFSSFLLADR